MLYLRKLSESAHLPLIAILSYLALMVTTLHLEVPILLSLHIELLLLLAAVGTSLHYIVFFEGKRFDYSHPLFFPSLLSLAFALSPLLSSFVMGDYFTILEDPEFKSFLKILIFVPFVYYFALKKETQNILLNSVVIFYVILGLYFLFRYFVLHEAREYDDRPTLSIRHGDPNFLCAFFSMTVPLALLQAQEFFKKRRSDLGLLYLGFAAFLAGCAVVTESRMGLMALIVGVGIVTYHFIRAKKIGLLPVFVSAVVGVILVLVIGSQTPLFKRFSEIKDKSSSDRVLTYENGIKVFLDHPLLGVGMNRAKDSYYENTRYPEFQSEGKLLVVHNTYLGLAAELGLFGTVIFLGMILWAWRGILKSRIEVRPFLIASLVIILLSAMTVGMAYKDLIIVQLFLLTGIAQSARRGML